MATHEGLAEKKEGLGWVSAFAPQRSAATAVWQRGQSLCKADFSSQPCRGDIQRAILNFGGLGLFVGRGVQKLQFQSPFFYPLGTFLAQT